MSEHPVGKTRDVGWQIGVSRTIPVDVAVAWNYLVSNEGLSTWLGAGVEPPIVRGLTYETADGTTGQFRSVRERDRIRLTWQPAHRPEDATVQVALTAAKTGCTFRFHTERLYDSAERELMREHWRAIADEIAASLSGRS